MIHEAVILCGGLGTRLRSAVPDLPKCMAPINGIPFLDIIIRHLQLQGIRHFILALGYKHEVIENHVKKEFPDIRFTFSVESSPLGTGGAIQLALQKSEGENVLVLNGDTLFLAPVASLYEYHIRQQADCSITLKPMKDMDRYGIVEITHEGRVSQFKEKKYYAEGLINGGVYLLKKEALLKQQLPESFSFEKEFLEKRTEDLMFMGLSSGAYFIDIGIPEDYARAAKELPKILPDIVPQFPDETNNSSLPKIDKDWTLFLDRDGVINHEKENDYIHTWSEFRFYEGVKEAIKTFSECFGRIIVVTNQRGVGRGLTKLDDLHDIHANMKEEVKKAGGRIDAIYYCSETDDDNYYRKPNPGMGHQACRQFPDIQLNKSIMVGNTLSDMRFGRNLGSYTVFLTTTRPHTDLSDSAIDIHYPSLYAFSEALGKIMKG